MSIYARHELDQERQAQVMHRTWELAMTGQYRDVDELGSVLRTEGLADAKRWLDVPLIRTRLADVCERAGRALLRPLPDPHETAAMSDESAIWHLLGAEVASFWMRDFEAYASCFEQSPRFRFQAWVREEGMTLREGWDTVAVRIRQDMERDPIQNPFFAFETVLENRNITINGDMAWCTFEAAYPTADLPGFRGPGREYDFRVVERRDSKWRAAFVGFFNLNFGQTDAPLWEVDATGKVLWQNSAAVLHLKNARDIVVRGGRLRMRQDSADERLREALGIVSNLDYGYLFRHRSLPVVVDPGHDLAATVWWVVAENGKLTVSFNDEPLLLARLDTAALAFGLSPAQHRLALALLEGLPLADAAARDGVSLSTAKTQLQRIFDKVGVRTQPALVRALLAVTERN
jgi:DNA-binding CsgD family transcriptional regulator